MSIILNPMLMKLQQLDAKAISRLADLHLRREALFTKARKWNRDGDLKRLRAGTKYLEKLEFEMQKAWKFELDSDKHSWRIEYPGCSCPREHEQNEYPRYNKINSHCKLHGKKD